MPDPDPQSLIEILDTILAPLGDARKPVLAWVEREIETHAIVQYVYEEGGPIVGDAGGPQLWRLGQPSPIDGDETIFAMFHWESSKAIAVYSFKQVEDGGRTGTLFFRTLLFKPIHVHGPVSGSALPLELAAFLEDEPEPAAGDGEQATANGAAS